MKEFLILQNYFGIPLEMYYQGKRKYHTVVGIVISFMINVTSLGFLIYLLTELISRSNPNVNIIHLSNMIGANMTMNTDDLIISLNVVDNAFKAFKDPTVFRIEFNYNVRLRHDDTFTEIPYPMNIVNCTEINLKKYEEHGLMKEFITNQLYDYYCFNGTEIHDKIVLGGLFGHDYYGYVNVMVYKCINGTVPGVECKSSEEIDNSLSGTWFEMFYLDHFVDIYDFASPIHTFSNNIFTQLDANYSKNLYAYFSKLDLNSNNNVILNSYTQKSTFKFEKINNDISSIKKGKIIDLAVMSSLNNEINNRYYIQLTTIAGNVAGILNAMNIAGSVFLYYVNHISYRSSLFNSLFEFYNKKPRKLNSLYTTDKSLKLDKADRYKVQLNLSLKKVFEMNFSCLNKSIRNEMKLEYRRIESIFYKYTDFLAFIKNQHIFTQVKHKLLLSMKTDSKETNRNLVDKIELNVYKEQIRFDSKLAMQSTKINLSFNQSKVNDSSLQKIQKEKYNNLIS